MTLDDIILDLILEEGPLTKEEILNMYRKGIQSGEYSADGAPNITVDSVLSTLLGNGSIEWKYGAQGFSSYSQAASQASDNALTTRLMALDRAIQAMPPSPTETYRSRCSSILQTAKAFEEFLMGVEPAEDSVGRSKQSDGGMIRVSARKMPSKPSVDPLTESMDWGDDE